MEQISHESPSERKYTVPAVARAIRILQVLAQMPEGLTISEISQQLGIAKSTVFTILNTLQQYDLVERDEPGGQFHLGMGLFTLGSVVVESRNPRAVARPILKRLVEQTNLTAHLGVIDHGEVVYIEKIESQAHIKVSSAVGGRMGLHCTALGKAMLASLPDQEVRRCFTSPLLPGRTPKTITTVSALIEELARVREQGYALDDEENEEGIRCLAAPVYNHHGDVYGAVSVSGLRDQLTPATIPDIARQVRHAANALSRSLGHSPSNGSGVQS